MPFYGQFNGRKFMRAFSGFLIVTLFATLMATMPYAVAQDANCADPQSTLEMKICASRNLEAADFELNANYQKARGSMREMDNMLEGDLVGAELALRDAQRLWIKYRDAACDAEGFTVRGGTLEGLIVTTCLERLTRQRSRELRLLYEMN